MSPRRSSVSAGCILILLACDVAAHADFVSYSSGMGETTPSPIQLSGVPNPIFTFGTGPTFWQTDDFTQLNICIITNLYI
jgi:hypothetical protein